METAPAIDIAKLARASRRSAIVTGAGALLLFGTLGYSAWQLHVLRDEVLDGQVYLEALTLELHGAKEQLRDTRVELKARQQELERVRRELLEARSANESVRKGISAYHEGRFADAIAAYNEALKLDAANPTAMSLRGQTLLRTGRVDDAIASLKQALDMQPSFMQAHYSLALAYWEAGEQRLAIEEVEALLDSHPEYYSTLRFDANFSQFYSASAYRDLLSNVAAKLTFVQRRLSELGYYRGEIDGIPGPGTRAAILRYQRENALSETGTWSAELIQHLQNESRH